MKKEKDIVVRLRDFMVMEARACSMDSGCVTAEYVYRMWGGEVPLEEIVSALTVVQRNL